MTERPDDDDDRPRRERQDRDDENRSARSNRDEEDDGPKRRSRRKKDEYENLDEHFESSAGPRHSRQEGDEYDELDDLFDSQWPKKKGPNSDRKRKQPDNSSDESTRRRHKTRPPQPPAPLSCPWQIKIAACIWVVLGLLTLLIAFIQLIRGLDAGGMDRFSMIMSIIGFVFGSGFVCLGIQTVEGIADGTLGYGIGSIVFGLFAFAAASVDDEKALAVLHLITGAALLAAGVLAIMRGEAYESWQKAARAKAEEEAQRAATLETESEGVGQSSSL